MSTSRIKWYKFLVCPGTLFLVIIAVATLFLAAYLGYLIPINIKNLFASYDDKNIFLGSIVSLGVIFIVEYVNRLFYQLSSEKYVNEVVLNIRNFSYKKWLHSYDLRKAKQKDKSYPLGEVMARIMNDTEAIRELVTSGSLNIFIDLFFIISCLISFIYLKKDLGGFVVLTEVLACFLLLWGSRKMRVVFLRVRHAVAGMSRTVANVTGGLSQGHYMNRSEYATKKGEQAFDKFLKVQLEANVWDASYYSLAESLFPILLALIVLILPYSPFVDVAILAAMIDLIQRSISPIKDIAGKLSGIQRASTGITRLVEFNQMLSDEENTEFVEIEMDDRKLSSVEVDIRSFHYHADQDQAGGKPFVLSQISFVAKKEQLVGIVGMSGSGKSTLMGILSGNIVTDSQSIQINFENGTDLKYPCTSSDISLYRSKVSLVSQDSHIFSASFRFNISMGLEQERVGPFWNFIMAEIDYLGEWGISLDQEITPDGLSLGQKQLISGIRACFLKRPIICFDEISSSLDSELELALRKLVLFSQRQALTFIVAHRIETVHQADQIIVLDQGKMVGVGTHSVLMAHNANYRDFVKEISYSV